MNARNAPRVIVVGGGILGASVTAHLVRAGAKVSLVTAGALADGASGRSLSWLNSSGDRSPEYRYLRMLGIDRYRTWRVRNPDSASYLRFDGGLKWAAADESFRATFDAERAAGYDALWIDRAQCAALVPEVDATAVAAEGAIFNLGEGWVHLPLLVTALATQASALGARIVEGAGVARLEQRGSAIVGITLDDGSRLEADHVVLATGSSIPAQLSELGIRIPDATPVACLVETEPLSITVRTVLNTPRVAVRPTPDGGLVLDAGWAERSVSVSPEGTPVVPEATVAGLLAEASKVLAGRPALRVRRVAAGPKPIPGDGEPVLGPVPGVHGLHVMFTHSGATLGLVAGELVAEEIVTGRPSPVLKPFRLERFSGSAGAWAATGAWAPVRAR